MKIVERSESSLKKWWLVTFRLWRCFYKVFLQTRFHHKLYTWASASFLFFFLLWNEIEGLMKFAVSFAPLRCEKIPSSGCKCRECSPKDTCLLLPYLTLDPLTNTWVRKRMCSKGRLHKTVMNESVYITVKKETHSFVLRPLLIEQWRQQIPYVMSCSQCPRSGHWRTTSVDKTYGWWTMVSGD